MIGPPDSLLSESWDHVRTWPNMVPNQKWSIRVDILEFHWLNKLSNDVAYHFHYNIVYWFACHYKNIQQNDFWMVRYHRPSSWQSMATSLMWFSIWLFSVELSIKNNIYIIWILNWYILYYWSKINVVKLFPLWQSVLDLHFRLSLGFLNFEHFSIGSLACVCLNWQIADLTWCPIPHFVLQSVQFVLLHFGHGWVALHFRFIFGFVNFFCLKQFFGLTLYFPLKQTIFLVWCPIPQDTSHGFQPRGSHRKTHWSQIVKSTGRFLASQNESGTLFVTEIKPQEPFVNHSTDLVGLHLA